MATSAGNPYQTLRFAAITSVLLGLACARPDPESAPAPPSQAAREVATQLDKRALLIGIQNYAGGTDDFPALHGTHRDLDLMRALLVDRFGFAPASVCVLRDEGATLEGIVRAIATKLIATATEDTEVLLYFSGHGSQVVDRSEQERGGMDSSLVAYDSRVDGRSGSHDLTDDALYSLLRSLTAERRARVTVISDTCHSGGSVRGGHFAARAAPTGTESAAPSAWGFWPDALPFLDDDERPVDRELARYVHIAACAFDETAWEYSFSAGDSGPEGWHGRFTWSLVQELQTAEPGVSYREIARRTAARMQALPAPPTAQSLWAEGELDRELFRSRFLPPPRGFAAELRGDHLLVHAGALHGLVAGTTLEVTATEARVVGQATVGELGYGTAKAEWLGRTSGLRPGLPLRVHVVARPRDLPRLRVETSDAALVELCGSSEWAHVRSGEQTKADYVLERSGARVRLRTSEGIPLWQSTQPSPSASLLESAFRRETQFRALWHLPNQRGELDDLVVEFVAPNDRELRDHPESNARFSAARVTKHRDPRGRGEVLASWYTATVPTYEAQALPTQVRQVAVIEIVNETFQDVFVHVLSLSENREVQVIWPEEGIRDRVLHEDAVPQRIRLQLGSPTAATWPLQRRMRERYLVIATKRPVDFHPFVRERTGTTRGSDLPGILQCVCGTSLTRGGGNVHDVTKGWGVAWVELQIVRDE